MTAARVFLADDSLAIRERVAGLLATRAFDVVGQAGTPQACIDGIATVRPDVVVLDVQLEGGTGLEVLRTIRRSHPAIAFVVLSNSASAPYRKRYLGEGALRFLDKSCEFELLGDAVAAACARPRQ
jgi:two-component system response regulator DesR